MENKYINAVVLSAAGDAMGWMTEFYFTKDDVLKAYGEFPLTKFHSWSKFNGSRFNGYLDTIAAGSYSDDTQLTLAVARSIKATGGVDHQYFAKVELSSWLEYKRGAGKTITEASHKVQRKSVNWNSNFFTYKQKDNTIDYRDCGANGAAMRVLPIALFYSSDVVTTLEEIFCNSIVTHGHPRAIVSAMLYGYIINTILNYGISSIEIITYIGKNFAVKFNEVLLGLQQKEELIFWFKKWNSTGRDFALEFNETIKECLSLLRQGYLVLKNKTDFDVFLHEIGLFEKETKGSGTISVIGALFCYCKYPNVSDGLIFTANLIGADTDSIAAFYGAMIGAYSNDTLFENYSEVQDYKYLKHIARNLFSPTNTAVKYNAISSEEAELIYNHPALGLGKILSSEVFSTITKNLQILRKEVDFDIGQSAVIITRIST